jgi:hypothetical protein
MLCEQCLQNSADILLTRFTSGAVTRNQLCHTCAEPLLKKIEADEITGATFLTPEGAGGRRRLPDEVRLSDPMTVQELAAALHLEPYQLVGTLMRQDVFAARKDTIDSATASRVCSLYGVNVIMKVG